VEKPSPSASDRSPFWSKEQPEFECGGRIYSASEYAKLPEEIQKHGRVVRGGMFPHQRKWWELNTFIKALIGGFGAGKTLIGAKRVIASALDNSGCMVAAVSPTFPLARKTIIPTISNLLAGKQARYGRGFWWKYNRTSHEFFIRHKGRDGWIQIMSAEDPDSLRGPNIASAWLDEPFLMEETAFRHMAARIRAGNSRELLLTGCVTRDTLVLPRSGMTPIGDLDPGTLPKQYRRIATDLYGSHRSFHHATSFFNNGVSETRRITVTNNYQIEATPDHPVLVMGDDGKPQWRPVGQLQIGDRVAIGRGMEVWGNVDPCEGFVPQQRRKVKKPLPQKIQMTKDLAYFLGLWLAEGSVEPGRLTITCGDPCVIKYLLTKGVLGLRFRKQSRDKLHVRLSSVELIDLMRHLGMPLVTAINKYIPQWVWNGRREWALSFLAGMWDGDGCAMRDGGGISYRTNSPRLARDVQCLLLNLGIVSIRQRTVEKEIQPDALVQTPTVGYYVECRAMNAAKLAKILSFRIRRKKQNASMHIRSMRCSDVLAGSSALILSAWRKRSKLTWRNWDGNLQPNVIRETAAGRPGVAYGTVRDFVRYWEMNEGTACPEIEILKQNLGDNYYWAKVRKIERGLAETVDFVVPETHSFWSNGFISHNTPEQINWGHDLLMGETREEFESREVTIGMVQASSRQNPATGKQYIRLLEGAFTHKMAEAFIDGGFVNLSKGQVYYGFQSIGDESNVRAIDIPDGAELGVGMDFNVNPMSAAVFWRLGERMHFFDEIELPNADTDMMCAELYDRYVNKETKVVPPQIAPLDDIFPDASGQSRHTSSARGKTDFHIIREYGFSVRAPHANPKVRDRQNAVNGKLRPVNGEITLTISPKCKKLQRYLLTYTHELSNRPEQKAMSHLLDAFSYPIHYLFPLARAHTGEYRLTGL